MTTTLALYLSRQHSVRSCTAFTGTIDLYRLYLIPTSRDVTWISSYSGGNTPLQVALADAWPVSPSISHPKGAGKWPLCPDEEGCSAGMVLPFKIRVIM